MMVPIIAGIRVCAGEDLVSDRLGPFTSCGIGNTSSSKHPSVRSDFISKAGSAIYSIVCLC